MTSADELHKMLDECVVGHEDCKLVEVETDCNTASEWMLDHYWVYDKVYTCSKCGDTFGHVAKERPKYCQNCGAKVINQ